jgi:hypothetical protein
MTNPLEGRLMSQETRSMMIYDRREPAGRNDDSQHPAMSEDTAAFGGLPEILNQSPKVQAQLKLDRTLNQLKNNDTGMPGDLKTGRQPQVGTAQFMMAADSDSDEEEKKSPAQERAEEIAARLEEEAQQIGIPEGHQVLWRFHNRAEEYQSHRFQNAPGGAIPDNDLEAFRVNREAQARHMYKSSRATESAGISFSRSLKDLLKESFFLGGDKQLRETVRGDEGHAAKFLSYTLAPEENLSLPENLKVADAIPKLGMKERNQLQEARERSLREKEALYMPPAGSGGAAPPPSQTIANPFVGLR